MKFGKYLEARQLELPEYNGYFINYKALKKLIKKLSLSTSSASLADAISPNEAQLNAITNDTLSPEPNTNTSLISNSSHKNLQLNKAVFFFRVERELEKVNEYYMEREKNFKIMIEGLQEKFEEYKRKGRLASKSSSSFKYLFESLKRLQRDLNHLTQYVELNRTGFAKVLKKWDKRSHSHTKDFYLATVVSVQPVFTRSLEISQFNDLSIGLLMELDDLRQEAPLHYDAANIAASSKSAAYSTTTSKDPIRNAEDIFETNLSILSIELEIDTWYKEVNSICQLKDLEPRLQLLKNFPNKVISFINESTKLSTKENELIIKGSLNRLFYLLVSSDKVDDECLETFFLSCDGLNNHIDFLYLDNDDSYIFTKRNFFHEAAACPNHDRDFILQQALRYYTLKNSQLVKFLNDIDYNGRTPLHYASELGKAQFVESLLKTQALTTIQAVDINSNSALVLAIIRNHPSIVQLLLTSYNRDNYLLSFSNEQREQQSPLNISCIKGNYDIVLIILNTLLKDFDLKNYRDVQGYKPLHLAAEYGADTKLLELLCDHGCDPNELDSVNGWTPLIYAVSNGHVRTVESLITHCHADIKQCDDKHLSPIFYACWQGHIGVLNVLMSHEQKINLSSVNGKKDFANTNASVETSGLRTDSSDLKPTHSMSLDIDSIPDFTLPPPIIPLRKYGHNFLEQKVFLKLHFKPGFSSIKLNEEDNGLVSAANLGRITLTSNLVDLISRNISLPIESSSSYYYTELGFNSNQSNNVTNLSSGNDVDSTDEVVFQINNLNNCNIDLEIYPVSGTRMIAKTILTYDILRNNIDSAVNLGSVVLPLLDSRLKLVGQIHFDFQVIYPFTNMPLEITQFETYWKSTGEGQMTSSSLSGEYVTILVTLLNDGKIVAVPKFTIQQADTEFLLMDLSAHQVESIIGRRLSDLSGATHDYKLLQEFIHNNYICFESLLKALPSDVKIGIKVAFPTDAEVSQVPVKLTSPYINIDNFVDDVLSITLNYIQSTQSMSSKKVVFSSSNHMICSILNWKQPVFPVIFNMNGVFKNAGSNSFAIESQNHLIQFALKKNFNHNDFNYRSVKDVVNFAKMNNLLGVIIPTELLLLGDSLIAEIKASGLLLIAGRSSKSETNENDLWNHPKINGIKNNRCLKFKDQNNEFIM